MFEFNNEEYSLEQITEAAKQSNMAFEDYIKEYNITEKAGKITPPKEESQGVPVEVNATPEIQPTITELPSEDISLDLVETAKTGTLAQTEFIPEPISKEREEEILLEYDKVSNIDIEQETINKKQSKLKRFQQGEFKLDEKEEFDYWKSSNGKLFEESEILSDQEIEDRKQTNQTVFLSKIPAYERQEIFAKNQKLIDEQVNFVNKSTEKRNNLVLQYNNIKNIDVKSKEDFIYKRNLINQIRFEDIERRRALSNLNKTEDLVDDFKRSYAFYDIAEQSFKTIGTDVAIGMMSTIDMLKTEEGQKASYLNELVDYREGLQQFAEENLAKPISIENVNSLDKAFVWGTQALANQLPTLAMAFTGQAALPLFFATGYGSKMSDFELGKRKAIKKLPSLEADLKTETNPEKRKEIQKNIDYHSRYLNVSDGIKVLTSLAHGGAEAIFEGLTTLKLVGDLQNIGNNILKAGGSRKAIYNAFKAAPMSIGLESLGESATQISQNAADILIFRDDKSLLENVSEAAAQGALFGSGFAIPNLGTAINAGIQSTISTRSDNAEIKKKLKEINDLTFELQSNGQLAPEDKKELQKNIQQKISEIVKTTDITRARFQRLSYKQQQEVFDLERQVGNSIQRWKDIGASNMNESTKNSLREEIKNEIQAAQNKKQSLLESGDARLKDLKTIPTEELLVDGDTEQSKQQYLRWKQGVETFIKKYNLPIELSIENLTEEQFKQYGIVGGSYSNKKITIYENIAPFINPSTPLHELTHAMLETFGLSKENFDKLEESFKALLEFKKANGIITDKQYNNTIAKYELYKKDKKTKKDASEELLTSFIDAIAENALDKKDVSFLTKIGQALKDIIASKTSKIEAENFDLNTAEGVYNFLTQFTESVAQGKKLKKMIGVEIPEKIKKETKVFSKSISGNNIQKIFDEKGKDGAFDIIEAYKPLTTKLTNKYRNVPGFDFELLQSEIEIGKRGLLDLINAYDPSKGATLNTYVQGQLANRSIEAANRILDTEFTVDVTEAKGVTDTAMEEAIETQEQAEIADEIKSLRKEIGLPEELITDVKNAVVKTFGTKLPNPQDPKFRFELQKRFRTELKKPMLQFVGKQADYESFLRDNFESVYSKMPQSLINRRFKEFAEPVLDKNGKQVREKTAEGNKVYVKKKINKAEWIKYFLGAEVGGSTKGARKTAIVEGIAEEIAFDATMEVLQSPDVINKYQDIAGITGEVLPENFKAVIAKQIDRSENFKFSKSLANQAKVKYSLSSQELASILFEKNMIELANDFPDIADSINNESFKKSYPKVFFDIVVPAFDKAVNTAIDNNDTILAEDIVFHFIKIFSRGTRSVSSKKGELKLTTNKALWENVIYPTIKGTGLSSNKKFNLLKSGQRSYIRYGDMAIGTLIDVTSSSVRNQIMSGEITKAEVNNKNADARDALQNIVFNIGKKHPGLAASIIKLNQKDQRTIFRGAATLNGIVQNYSGETVYEHNPPVQFVFNEIIDYFKNPSDSKKNDLKNLFNTMEANLVPKDFAEIVDEKYKDKMPPKGIFRYSDALSKTDYTFDEGEFKYSKSLSKDFNQIIENKTGIAADKVYKKAKAEVVGASKGKWKFFIPPGAEDFVGLLYATLSKGKLGDQQMAWYKYNLLNPYTDALNNITRDRVQLAKDFKELKKQLKIVPKNLRKKLPGTQYSQQDAVRVYIWNKQGVDMLTEENGMDKADLDQLVEFVEKDPNLLKFADQLMEITQGEYASPGAKWWNSGTIDADLLKTLSTTRRAKYLEQSGWTENVSTIFSKENLNKLEAAYGKPYRIALENILKRMKSGRNRSFGGDALTSRFTDWISNSIGTIMFLNSRSAVLQTISAVNFINWSDNNILAVAKTFANPKQWAKDFMMLMNSPFLIERRNGLKIDVNESEIADLAKTSTNKAKAIMGQLLKAGFLPTQIADSFAIASGGASFYRNRFNSLVKEGYTKEEAEVIAMRDFRETATESQQSSDPSRISQQQAGPLGRIVLAFANTPAQYARLTKKAVLDIKNGRGDLKTNVSKIIYYMVVQNIIFTALQQALFAVAFGDEEEEEDEMNKKYIRMANSMSDSILRGLGFAGAAVSVAKNVAIKIAQESDKKSPKFEEAAWKLLEISPPISSKISKFRSAGRQISWNRKEIREKGLSLENPAAMAGAQIIAGATNLPVDRALRKIDNVQNALSEDAEMWQRVALLSGWQDWELGMKQTEKSNKFKKFTKFKKFKKFKK